MNGAILEKIYQARVQLRARGEKDTQTAVREITGGSKSTLVKYWAVTDPATYTPSVTAGGPEVSTHNVLQPTDAPAPTHANGVTAPGGPTDAEFEASFHAYVEAGMRWLATQGLMGNEDVFACAKTYRWATRRPTAYAISRWHPLVEQLENELEARYEEHLALWEEWQAAHDPAPLPAPAPAPEPAPAPAPALFDLPNLKQYYFDRTRSPWPGGTGLPATQEVYDVLKQLHQEADALETKTGRERYTVMNALGQSGGMADETPLRMAEDRWSAARFITHRIKADMDQMKENARYEGRTLT